MSIDAEVGPGLTCACRSTVRRIVRNDDFATPEEVGVNRMRAGTEHASARPSTITRALPGASMRKAAPAGRDPCRRDEQRRRLDGHCCSRSQKAGDSQVPLQEAQKHPGPTSQPLVRRCGPDEARLAAPRPLLRSSATRAGPALASCLETLKRTAAVPSLL